MRCFSVSTKEIDFRIDPDYYLPEIFGLLRELKKSPYKLETLDDISQRVVDGPFGSAIKSEDYVEVGIPFIRVADVTKGNGTIRTNDMVFISKDVHERIKRSKVSPGDVVIAKTGATMGAASIVPNTIEEGNIRGDLAAITLDNEVVAQYLVNFINTTIGQKLFWRLNSGATRGRVVIGNLKKLQVIVPPEKIMVRINEILETAQSIKKQKETEAQRLLDSIDDYVLGELGIELPEFEHKMCFSVRAGEVEDKRVDSEYYQIHFDYYNKALMSGKYECIPLNSITDMITNGRTGAKEDYTDSTGLPIIKVAAASKKFVDLAKLQYVHQNFHGGKVVQKGDIFILSSAHQSEYIGKNVSYLLEQPKKALIL